MRNPFIAIFALLCVFLPASIAFAEDYTVDIGVDTKAGRDAGTFTCRFDQRCEAKIELLKLKVMVDIYHSDRLAYVRIASMNEIGCCYFEHGVSSISVDPQNPISKLMFFKGFEAGSAQLIENEGVGTLYLKFHYRSSVNQ